MRQFILTDEQERKIKEWDNPETGHVCSLKRENGNGKYAGAIGGHLSYSFTPTSIGEIVTVKCACGAELDVTDYDSF
jgi:hypothetical protein